MIAGVGDVQTILTIDTQPLGTVEFSNTRAGLSQADNARWRTVNIVCVNAVGLACFAALEHKFLNPLNSLIFANPNLALRINRHRPRQRKLAEVGSMSAPLIDQ